MTDRNQQTASADIPPPVALLQMMTGYWISPWTKPTLCARFSPAAIAELRAREGIAHRQRKPRAKTAYQDKEWENDLELLLCHS